MKTRATLLIVGALALVGVLSIGGFLVKVWLAPFFGWGNAVIKVNDADNRIASYNHFYDLCTNVQANEGRIEALNAELKFADKDRKGQIYATLTAISGQRSEDIAQYNNDAAKGFTIGQFRASNLPFRLDSTLENTTCAY